MQSTHKKRTTPLPEGPSLVASLSVALAAVLLFVVWPRLAGQAQGGHLNKHGHDVLYVCGELSRLIHDS